VKKSQYPTLAVIFNMFLIATSTLVYSQVFTPLYELGTNSGEPNQPLGVFAQGRDGNLYSTSYGGGAHGDAGTVFRLTPGGALKVLYSFDPAGVGAVHPSSGLTLGIDGNLYGTTQVGGPDNAGTVFKITPSGTTTILHTFSAHTEGSRPEVAPIQGTDGNFYGTTHYDHFEGHYGGVYKMTRSGKLTVLAVGIGSIPSGLIQGTDGSFYGTTRGTGAGDGTAFKITPQGKFKTLHTFVGYPGDGNLPYGPPIEAIDGNFYGTTQKGGAHNAGTFYKMSPPGVVTILFSFPAPGTQGYWPLASPVQASDGNFYGTAYGGGTKGTGALFRISPAGSYELLYNDFTGVSGTHPEEPLLQNTNGIFYSATYEGGTGTGVNCLYCGVLYSLNVGLDPFVAFLPQQSSGKVGKTISLFGQGLTGTTAVRFGGASASFTVVSDTYLIATIPSEAQSGMINVDTPGGILASNKFFRVTPQIVSFEPLSGPVGTSITIKGVSLLQTTKVTFGGVKATAIVIDSDTQITVTVPPGAKTGKITVTTVGGSASSKAKFTVTP